MRAIARTALIAAALMLRASMADAASIRVLSASAAEPAVQTLALEFTKDTGHEITLTLGSPAQVMEKIKAGEIFDALIASEGAMDELDRDGIVNPEAGYGWQAARRLSQMRRPPGSRARAHPRSSTRGR